MLKERFLFRGVVNDTGWNEGMDCLGDAVGAGKSLYGVVSDASAGLPPAAQ